MKKPDEERLARLEIEIRGTLTALEILMITMAQRVPQGGQSVAAAIEMLDRVSADALEEPDTDLAGLRARVFDQASQLLLKIAVEVVGFNNGDGVTKI
jgi:hypothetical protein